MLIYLAGKIDGLSWNKANGWREKAATELCSRGISVYNPLMHVAHLKGISRITPEVVQDTKDQIPVDDEFYLKHSDIMLCNLENDDVTGTLMEIGYMRALGKLILGFGNSKLCKHPFIEKWVDLKFNNLDDALEYIIDLLSQLGGAY